MMPRKEDKAPAGSLEAALRELKTPPPAEQIAPTSPESPTEARPGEHTATSPRSIEQEQRKGFRQWGRCGYVPEPEHP
jgi:hypothetical protein